MDVVIVGAGMPFGPDTLKFKSLGGSETAQLMLGKSLAKLGARVVNITNLPAPGAPDFVASGSVGADGVRYLSIQEWERAVCTVPHDLLIISRDMRMASAPHQAKHAVFWAHDLATHGFMAPALTANSWNINEVWAVSEWHADQIHAVTGYPRDRIIAMRNGIVNVEEESVVGEQFNFDKGNELPLTKRLIYAARPERGLEALLRPGGIMEKLPDYNLVFAMYDHFPEHMRPLYEWCMRRAQEMPNVDFIGSLRQADMRREIARSSAYVYPTMFEETSCILARECIEQGVPFLTGKVGALPETLGDCGVFIEDFRIEKFANRADKPSLAWNSDEYCDTFARMVRFVIEGESSSRQDCIDAMAERDDLYWEDVAEAMIARVKSRRTENSFSIVKSLVEDGDAIAALYLVDQIETAAAEANVSIPEVEQQFYNYLRGVYHFVDFNDEQMGAYYEAATKHWTAKYPTQHQADPVHDGMWNVERHRAIRDHLAATNLPAGSLVFEFGCAEGNLVLNLARTFPHLHFIAADFDALARQKCVEYAEKHGITNVEVMAVDLAETILSERKSDYTICTEVLEHVRYPWTHLKRLEGLTRFNSPIVLSTPFGGWEAMQWSEFGHDYFRQHIWEFTETDFKEMIGHKHGFNVAQVSAYGSRDGRVKGHRVVTFNADASPVFEINLRRKIMEHHPRQTVTACIITKDAAHSLPTLFNTLWKNVDAVHVALGPSTDRTRHVIEDFALRYPWIPVRIVDVPAIENRKFGFDDARNASIEELATDWFLWVDSDEYVVGDIRKYLRDNALQSYGIHQHHFTVEPRGAPAQIDRPARLCRAGMQFYGKIHEHAEVSYNGGPGYSLLLGDVDIGHVGYANEVVRRARFERNFPFLEWDRELNPDRQLGAYLWFRDILHRMRYAHEAGRRDISFALAQEAIDFYSAKLKDIIKFGAGAGVALAYFSEAMRYLQRGREVKQVIILDGSPVELVGQIDDYDSQMGVIIKAMLDPELEKARGKYWR